jgi:Putative 2OG-Fe(II) oxygenase
MIDYQGDITLFHVSAHKFMVQGIDNIKLADEILKCQQRLSDNPVVPLFEDTIFDPEPESEGRGLLDLLAVKFSQHNLAIAQQWSQIHQPLESTGLHNHHSQNNLYAFVYYVRVPVNAGMLSFQFENDALTTIHPVGGELYMFPAWVKHKVSKNLSNEIRISVAGNLVEA